MRIRGRARRGDALEREEGGGAALDKAERGTGQRRAWGRGGDALERCGRRRRGRVGGGEGGCA